MFIPPLEFRKYVQKPRNSDEKKQKLIELAERWLHRRDCPYPPTTPLSVVVADIQESYDKGLDILDPQFFTKEDIIAFAKENGLLSDPMVLAII